MSSVAQADVTAWIWGDMDWQTETNMAGMRLGYMGEKNIEIGVTAQCFAERPRDEVFGGYILLHAGEAVSIDNPLPLGPPTIIADPYGGYQALFDPSRNGSLSGFVSGFKFMEIMFIEYQWRMAEGDFETDRNDEHAVAMGARLQF